MTGATGNWYCGLHEPSDMAFVLHSLRPGDLFVDIGANIGSYTILASQAGARVVSFEPIPSTYTRLRQNIALNDVGHIVDARCQGVSSQEGTLIFTCNSDTTNHVVRDEDIEDIEKCKVPVTTIDSSLQNQVPNIIKIDVEGHESEVLKGAAKTLQSPDLRAIIMETNGSGSAYGIKDEDLVLLLESYGFRSVAYDPIHRFLTQILPNNKGNTIFVRDIEQQQVLLKSSKKYKLINTLI